MAVVDHLKYLKKQEQLDQSASALLEKARYVLHGPEREELMIKIAFWRGCAAVYQEIAGEILQERQLQQFKGVAPDVRYLTYAQLVLKEPFGPPHDDPNVLHAPSTCLYCDYHPKLQRARPVLGINFTGIHDENFLSCPSESSTYGTPKPKSKKHSSGSPPPEVT